MNSSAKRQKKRKNFSYIIPIIWSGFPPLFFPECSFQSTIKNVTKKDKHICRKIYINPMEKLNSPQTLCNAHGISIPFSSTKRNVKTKKKGGAITPEISMLEIRTRKSTSFVCFLFRVFTFFFQQFRFFF